MVFPGVQPEPGLELCLLLRKNHDNFNFSYENGDDNFD